MNKSITEHTAIEEIYFFSNYNNSIPIEKIEYWLLKYTDLYKNLKYYEIEIIDIIDRLPSSIKPTNTEIFYNLFEELSIISDLHRNEEYFKHEMKLFEKNKNCAKFKSNWILKNEYIGSDTYCDFFINYLDYNENPNNLNIFIYSLKDLRIFISRENFIHTIYFLEIFNKIY